jgi:hypothetical protein
VTIVQAGLLYRPHGFGGERPVIIGTTNDVGALRIVRDRVLADATAEVERWRTLDPGLAALKLGEVDRLTRVLAIVLADEDLRRELRLVRRPDPSGPPRDPSE